MIKNSSFLLVWVMVIQFPSSCMACMTTSSEFPEKPKSKSRARTSSFITKKSSTNVERSIPYKNRQKWSHENTKSHFSKDGETAPRIFFPLCLGFPEVCCQEKKKKSQNTSVKKVRKVVKKLSPRNAKVFHVQSILEPQNMMWACKISNGRSHRLKRSSTYFLARISQIS